MTWLRLSINLELGRPGPDPHDSAVPHPDDQPSDPTRRDPED